MTHEEWYKATKDFERRWPEKPKTSKVLAEFGQTYSAKVKCFNCGRMATYAVPLGMTTHTYLLGAYCENCGCNLGDNK